MSHRSNTGRSLRFLTVSAMLCALGVVLLALGSVIDVIDLSVAVLASLFAVYAVIEMGGIYPWLIWIVTSVLSCLLLPQKTPAIFYACFFGFYPICKAKIEGHLKNPLGYVCKLLLFHASLALLYGVFRLFLPSQLEGYGLGWLLFATYAAALLCFVLYDFCLSRLITFYLYRLQKRFHLRR